MFQYPIYSNKWKNIFRPPSVWYLENNNYKQQSNENPKHIYVSSMRGITLNIRDFSSADDRIKSWFIFSIMPTGKGGN
jgi:hypothetical protein